MRNDMNSSACERNIISARFCAWKTFRLLAPSIVQCQMFGHVRKCCISLGQNPCVTLSLWHGVIQRQEMLVSLILNTESAQRCTKNTMDGLIETLVLYKSRQFFLASRLFGCFFLTSVFMARRKQPTFVSIYGNQAAFTIMEYCNITSVKG